MTSKHPICSFRRHPLKRVRLDDENQPNGRTNKKFARQSSQDSSCVEIEKSSDQRAYDLFYKEYFPQFCPYFKNRSIAIQLIEHFWSNMIESSKVAFIKKSFKEQDINNGSSNQNETFSKDENDSQLNKSDENNSILNLQNKYSRAFLNDLLFYLKHCISSLF